jgi:hypothetical protein
MAENIEDIGRRHGFGPEATRVVAEALRHGSSRLAQFSHQELGGMGQWAAGGMIMIGDMFNQSLKARVDALCNELAPVVTSSAAPSPTPHGLTRGSGWWPVELGGASATGAQNDMRYACFPDKRRLAVMRNGQVKIYDTGEHRIGGFSQQQSGAQTLSFSSQLGTVRLDDLTEV